MGDIPGQDDNKQTNQEVNFLKHLSIYCAETDIFDLVTGNLPRWEDAIDPEKKFSEKEKKRAYEKRNGDFGKNAEKVDNVLKKFDLTSFFLDGASGGQVLAGNAFDLSFGVDCHLLMGYPNVLFSPFQIHLGFILDPFALLPVGIPVLNIGCNVRVGLWGIKHISKSDTGGLILLRPFEHLPILYGKYILESLMSNDTVSFYGTKKVLVSGGYQVANAYTQVMSCWDVGMPLNVTFGLGDLSGTKKLGKKMALNSIPYPSMYMPSSISLPISAFLSQVYIPNESIGDYHKAFSFEEILGKIVFGELFNWAGRFLKQIYTRIKYKTWNIDKLEAKITDLEGKYSNNKPDPNKPSIPDQKTKVNNLKKEALAIDKSKPEPKTIEDAKQHLENELKDAKTYESNLGIINSNNTKINEKNKIIFNIDDEFNQTKQSFDTLRGKYSSHDINESNLSQKVSEAENATNQAKLEKSKADQNYERAQNAEKKARKDAQNAEIKAQNDAKNAEKKAQNDAKNAEKKARKDAQNAEIEARNDAQNAEKKAQKDAQNAENAAKIDANNKYEIAKTEAHKLKESANTSDLKAAEDAKKNAYKAAEEAKNKAYEAAEEAKKNAYKAAEEAKKNAYKAAKEAKKNAYKAAKEAKNKAYEAAKDAKDKAYDAAKEAKNNANIAAEEAKTNLENANRISKDLNKLKTDLDNLNKLKTSKQKLEQEISDLKNNNQSLEAKNTNILKNYNKLQFSEKNANDKLLKFNSKVGELKVQQTILNDLENSLGNIKNEYELIMTRIGQKNNIWAPNNQTNKFDVKTFKNGFPSISKLLLNAGMIGVGLLEQKTDFIRDNIVNRFFEPSNLPHIQNDSNQNQNQEQGQNQDQDQNQNQENNNN